MKNLLLELESKVKDCANTNTIFDTRKYILLEDAEEILNKASHSKDKIIKRIEFLEKDYEIAYDLRRSLDMYDENEAADFDELSEQLKQTKTKIAVLEWILES